MVNFRARLNEIFTDLTSLDVKKKLESLMVFVAMRQYFSLFYILRWSTNLHKLSNFSSIFSVGLLKAVCGALDWSVVR